MEQESDERMKFTEIDGKMYDIKCCTRCPFFYNGAYHDCNHPERDVKKRMSIGLFETNKRCDAGCPLRDKPESVDRKEAVE